eukprot:m.861469 g.861469  ORF g.861469 m.861469 type:complete len:479 (+) comp23533_c0_seq2:319-1755(+)
MASAWVLGPDRQLRLPPKEPVTEYDEEATFYPDMISNEVLRDTVPSSGYGYVLPAPHDEYTKETTDRIIREMEAELTFKPKLNLSPRGKMIRKSTPSSGYGKRSVKPKPKVEPKAVEQDGQRLFKPRLVSNSSIRQEVPSSGYGRRTVKAKTQPQTKEPTPKFKPKLNNSTMSKALRKAAGSSGYGKKPVVVPKREPLSPEEKSTRVSMHTLLLDKAPEYDNAEDNTEPDDFVFDGHRIANLCPLRSKFVTNIHPLAMNPPPLPAVPTKYKKVLGNVTSSRYGKVTPPTVPAPPPKPEEPRWELALRSTRDEDEVEQAEAEDELYHVIEENRQRFAGVPSSGYGEHIPKKYIGQRPPEPVILPFKSGGPNTSGTFPSPEPIERNPLTDRVGSHGYGLMSPAVVPRPERETTPIWVPASAKPVIPEPEQPPRSRLTDTVESFYGPYYDPSGAEHGEYSDEEEEEEEEPEEGEDAGDEED